MSQQSSTSKQTDARDYRARCDQVQANYMFMPVSGNICVCSKNLSILGPCRAIVWFDIQMLHFRFGVGRSRATRAPPSLLSLVLCQWPWGSLIKPFLIICLCLRVLYEIARHLLGSLCTQPQYFFAHYCALFYQIRKRTRAKWQHTKYVDYSRMCVCMCVVTTDLVVAAAAVRWWWKKPVIVEFTISRKRPGPDDKTDDCVFSPSLLTSSAAKAAEY